MRAGGGRQVSKARFLAASATAFGAAWAVTAVLAAPVTGVLYQASHRGPLGAGLSWPVFAVILAPMTFALGAVAGGVFAAVTFPWWRAGVDSTARRRASRASASAQSRGR